MLQTTPVNWRLFGVNSATNSSPVHKYGGSIMGCSSGRCYVQWATVVPLQTSPMSSSLLARSRQLVRNSVVSEQTNEEQPLHASDSTPASGADMARKLVPNAKAIKVNAHMRVQHSLGVDFGDARTGIATSFRGFAPTPLSVCKLRGDKLVGHLLEVASKQKADEFIVGLPQSWDGKETDRSNKTRSFAGRLAQHAADRGWRVYLQDEHGTSQDALDYMIHFGSNKRSRKDLLDAYAAMLLLRHYFDSGGEQAQLVLPKKTVLQERLFALSDELRLRGHDDWEDES